MWLHLTSLRQSFLGLLSLGIFLIDVLKCDQQLSSYCKLISMNQRSTKGTSSVSVGIIRGWAVISWKEQRDPLLNSIPKCQQEQIPAAFAASIPRKNAFSSVRGNIFPNFSPHFSWWKGRRVCVRRVGVDPVSLWKCRNMDFMASIINALGWSLEIGSFWPGADGNHWVAVTGVDGDTWMLHFCSHPRNLWRLQLGFQRFLCLDWTLEQLFPCDLLPL